MSPKNAIKIINIQKYIQSTSVLFGPRWSIMATLVLFSSHWSYSIYIGPIQSNLSTQSYLFDIGPIRSTMIIFSPICSYSVHIGLHCLIQFTLSYSILVPIQTYFVHLVHFVPFGPFVFTSVHLDHFNAFWFTSVHFVHLHRGKRHV